MSGGLVGRLMGLWNFNDLRGFSGKVLGETGNGFYGDEAFC